MIGTFAYAIFVQVGFLPQSPAAIRTQPAVTHVLPPSGIAHLGPSDMYHQICDVVSAVGMGDEPRRAEVYAVTRRNAGAQTWRSQQCCGPAIPAKRRHEIRPRGIGD